jgi:hypothetical protein
MAAALSYAERLDSQNEKQELLPKYIFCTECKEIGVQERFPVLGQTTEDPCNSPTSKRRRLRRALHHHKTPHAYEDAPFLETPCPLCFFKQCRKVLRQWMRKQKKPFSAVTVQIDRLTSEQYEENVSTSPCTSGYFPNTRSRTLVDSQTSLRLSGSRTLVPRKRLGPFGKSCMLPARGP